MWPQMTMTETRKARRAPVRKGERTAIWNDYLNGMHYSDLMKKYDISEAGLYRHLKLKRKKYGIPKAVGAERARIIMMKRELEKAQPEQAQPNNTITSTSQQPLQIVSFGDQTESREPSVHQHQLKHNSDKNIVFCSDCGERWVKE